MENEDGISVYATDGPTTGDEVVVNVKATSEVTIIDITDAYSVDLTRSSYVFSGDNTGAAAGLTCDTQVIAYQGSQLCSTVSIGSITCPTGISATVTNNNTSTPTITFKTTATLTSACEATIPVTVDDVTINKKFSFAVALKGDTGTPGAAGKSIGAITNYYLATASSSGVTTSTSGWTTAVQSVSSSKKYLWNYEVIKYSDGTTASTSSPCIIGVYGDTGNGVSSITEYYQVSTSNTTEPTSWVTSVPTMTSTNKYLWNYEVITFTDGSTKTTSKRVIGVHGDTGANGDPAENLRLFAIDKDTGSIYGTNGYLDGYRLNSTGTNSAMAGSVVTGYIACSPSIESITLGGVVFTYSTTVPLKYLAFYDSSFAIVGYMQVHSTGIGSTHSSCSLEIVTSSNATKIVLTLPDSLAQQIAYFRLSAEGSGANMTIAVKNKEGITSSDVVKYVSSRGENLVTNGTCLLGDNTNFSSFTYDGSDTYYAGGCFTKSGRSVACEADEYIPVDVSQKYELSYYIKVDDASMVNYDMIKMYDIDKNEIAAQHTRFISGSTTTLAQDLKNGDTIVYLTSAQGFDASKTESYQCGLIFWNYTNSKGYVYEPETYSKNYYWGLWTTGSTAIDKTNHTITLDSAWSNGTIPAGTSVSQSSSGSANTYLNASYRCDAADTWFHKTGTISGVLSNQSSIRAFRPGTAFVKIGWYLNLEGSTNDGKITKLSTITFTQNASLKDMVSSVDVEYYLSTSSTSLTGGSWSTTAPTWVNGKYMWSRTVTVDGLGNKTYSPSQNGVCIAGAAGSDGKGVSSYVEEYYRSTSATSLTGGSWSTTYPGWASGTYIWTRSKITYTDNTTTTTTAICVTGDKGSDGDQGYSLVAYVSRENFTEANWATYGTIGHVENWSNTESIRNGCRVGDLFAITGTATDTKNSHQLVYRSDNSSGTLHGECIAHTITPAGSDGSDGESVKSVTRYYCLATTAPNKPTANPPGGNWDDTEPEYEYDPASSLYFVDLTVFTDNTFEYSEVSKSSSYSAVTGVQVGSKNLIRNSRDLIFDKYKFDSSYVDTGSDGGVTYEEAEDMTLVYQIGLSASHDGAGNVTIK